MIDIFRNVLEADRKLSGSEQKVSFAFCARGARQRGGFAPWPLFSLRWIYNGGGITLRHNSTNQIKSPCGQINLDRTRFPEIENWQHYLIGLERLNGGRVFTKIYINGEPIWNHECTELSVSHRAVNGETPGMQIYHPFDGNEPHAAFSYIVLAFGIDAADLLKIIREGSDGFNPFEYPEADEQLFQFEPLPEPPEDWTYDGDAYPFFRFSDGSCGLDSCSLPGSGNQVMMVKVPETLSSMGFDAVVQKECRTGGNSFTNITDAVASLGAGGGRIFIYPGIYTETLRLDSEDLILTGADPFRTIITGYEARTNGIGRNILVGYNGGAHGCKSGRFRAENLCFYNRGAEWNEFINHPESRGAALAVENLCRGEFLNCLFLGRQDTLYLKNGSMKFKNCYIEGSVDFICGGASAEFHDCHLHCLLTPEGYITAAAPLNSCGCGTSEEPEGFYFRRCLVTMDPRQEVPLYLGRGPWIHGSGLPDGRNSEIRSRCTFRDCRFGLPGRPFLLNPETHWRSMDRDWTEEIYREYGNSLNGRILADFTGRKS